MTRTLVVTGGGGVGKTTVAAALGVTAARSGIETLVVTVDPARRLADALGLEHLGNDPTPTRLPGLSAAMLDATSSWEEVVLREAEPEEAERLLASPFFRAIADRFPAGQAYAAGAEMARHVESGTFDLIVVDTPPASGGIDFFLAPGQIRSLVGGRLLRWGTGGRLPARRTLFAFTARPVLRLADVILGGPLLEDVAEFLLDLRTIYDGLAKRAKRIERHFRRATTLVVTTADPAPLREAARFFRELPDVATRPMAVLFNRALPLEWADAKVPDGTPALAAENLARWAAEAQRQADARVEFAARLKVTPAALPWLPEAPTDLDALGSLLAQAEDLDLKRLGIAGR